MFVFTEDQMKAADGYAIRTMGIPGVTLMGSAAQGIAETIHEMSPGARRAVMVCGSGNNGGDGLALAGILALQGADVSVVLASARALSEDAAYYFNRLPEQVRTLRFADDGEQCLREIAGADVVVDALYGTGFRGSLRGGRACRRHERVGRRRVQRGHSERLQLRYRRRGGRRRAGGLYGDLFQ